MFLSGGRADWSINREAAKDVWRSDARMNRHLLEAMVKLTRQYPGYGYRIITAKLRQAGRQVNAKRVYRPWRQEGVRVPQKQRKRRRLGTTLEDRFPTKVYGRSADDGRHEVGQKDRLTAGHSTDFATACRPMKTTPVIAHRIAPSTPRTIIDITRREYEAPVIKL